MSVALALSPGQEVDHLGLLLLALVLSAAIGLEREALQKSAGLRTHTLVGLGAALFVMVSKYGFGDVLEPGRVVLDPSRVAAQIVSGIGFIGAGVIFVRRDAVRGLTTAAVIWMTAAVGAACGAGLPLLAVSVTIGHLGVLYGFSWLAHRLPLGKNRVHTLRISYTDGRGALRRAMTVCTDAGFAVTELHVERPATATGQDSGRDRWHARDEPTGDESGIVSVSLEVVGGSSITELAARLSDVDGVTAVTAGGHDYHYE